MFATIKALRYWKTEHDAQSCEDACHYDLTRGLFAVADGVGTASFSNLWSDTLVKHFVATPLTSDDPFELEWWLRAAQKKFEAHPQLPSIAYLQQNDPLVVEKARQGSLSTLAGLRLVEAGANYVKAQAISTVLGDTCIFARFNDDPSLCSYPLVQAREFDRNPICLPTKPARFNRWFHECRATPVFDLKDGDVIVIATDAVAKWILSRGNRKSGFANVNQCFDQIIQCRNNDDWKSFIDYSRTNAQMIDDDCTALVIQFSQAAPPHTLNSFDVHGVVGATPFLDQNTVSTRIGQLETAYRMNDKEQYAICFGDGVHVIRDLTKRYASDIDANFMARARIVTDGLQRIRSVMQHATEKNLDIAQAVKPVWEQYGRSLNLQNEPCAKNIVASLKQLGVIEATPNTRQGFKRGV